MINLCPSDDSPSSLTQLISIMTSKEKLVLYATKIDSINSKLKLRAVWVAKNLLRIAEEVKSEKLEKLITSVLTQEKFTTVNPPVFS